MMMTLKKWIFPELIQESCDPSLDEIQESLMDIVMGVESPDGKRT